jgi:hypothetical protein
MEDWICIHFQIICVRLLLRVNDPGPSWSVYSDLAVWIGLNSMALWKEDIESIDEIRMRIEQLTDSVNYASRINSVICLPC